MWFYRNQNSRSIFNLAIENLEDHYLNGLFFKLFVFITP